MTSVKLDNKMHRLMSSINRVSFMNPYCRERLEIENEVFNCCISDDEPRFHVKYCETIRDALRTLGISHARDLRKYAKEDANLLRVSMSLEQYIQYSPQFDELIVRQLHAPDTNIRAQFVDELIDNLLQIGFDAKTAHSLASLFFQYRRAHYFICRYLIGSAPCMRHLRQHLWDAVFTRNGFRYIRHLIGKLSSFSTLIVGETGTGKGTAAVAMSRSGFIPYNKRTKCFAERFTDNHISINISQFPETLIESELFGHVKGAFTGAISDKPGLLEKSSRFSTVFIDEIGELAVPIQVKLLQILQDRKFSRVGETALRDFHGRVVCATNKDIGKMRHEKTFRDDLYYRISSDVIIIPTLRERIREDKNELRPMIQHIVSRVIGKKSESIVREVERAIERDLPANYDWPGNVRELEQCVRRVILTGAYRGSLESQQSLEDPGVRDVYQQLKTQGLKVKDVVAAYSKHVYQDVGSIARTSELLGIDRRTVRKILSEEQLH